MKNLNKNILIFIIINTILITSCQKQSNSININNMQLNENNSLSTFEINNIRINEELKILVQLINGEFESIITYKRKNKFINNYKNTSANQCKILEKLYKKLSLYSLIFPLKNQNNKNFLIGKLYFENQKFIKAAIKLDQIIKKKINYPQAKNISAKIFYFLGNPDRSLNELNFMLKYQQNNKKEKISAQFLNNIIIKNYKIELILRLKKTILIFESKIKNNKNLLKNLKNNLRIIELKNI